MTAGEPEPPAGARRWWLAAALALPAVAAPLALLGDPVLAGAGAVAGLCLALWLSEAVPPTCRRSCSGP